MVFGKPSWPGQTNVVRCWLDDYDDGRTVARAADCKECSICQPNQLTAVKGRNGKQNEINSWSAIIQYSNTISSTHTTQHTPNDMVHMLNPRIHLSRNEMPASQSYWIDGYTHLSMSVLRPVGV